MLTRENEAVEARAGEAAEAVVREKERARQAGFERKEAGVARAALQKQLKAASKELGTAQAALEKETAAAAKLKRELGVCTPSVRLASGRRTENVDGDEREKAADGEGA